MKSLAALLLLLALPQAAGATVYDALLLMRLEFLGLGGAEATSTATGLVTVHTSATGSSHLSTLTLPTLSLVDQVPLSGAGNITSLLVDVRRRPDLQGGVLGNVSGAAASAAGGLSPNTVAATGSATLCLLVLPLPPCVAQLPLTLGRSSSGAYLGSGVGGVYTIGSGSSIRISLIGAPYTVKTVTGVARTSNGAFEVMKANGFAHGPASFTSSTAASGGILQLVTATRVPLIGPGGRDLEGIVSTVRVALIPEPALLASLAAGAALVGLLGVRRRRS